MLSFWFTAVHTDSVFANILEQFKVKPQGNGKPLSLNLLDLNWTKNQTTSGVSTTLHFKEEQSTQSSRLRARCESH